ncbi:4Fe-4S dicluster domain-containing protein [Thermanaerosceptrum fracticalcis]|uniref:Glycolate oxidase iron-sulfur subunit n=2 Tax=Thermanaerosceptrum fracticalcis TaxID=1712410 RepID=A0A7G6E2V5_THEFR|nr:4Fe-4S dicluster domain-containing protein [Thermanaerosceptrum fracticalcis]
MTMSQGTCDLMQRELAKCIKCGTCRSVCPVFQEVDSEALVARGKLRLVEAVLEGKLDYTPGFAERMSLCLLCKACASACPSGVKADKVFVKMREMLVEKRGLHAVKRFVFTWLKYRRIFDWSLRFGAVFQNLFFKTAQQGTGKEARIPIPVAGLNKRRIIPPLAVRPFRSQMPEVIKVLKPRMKVAFFTGCMMNYIYPDAAHSLVNVLRKNDIEVVVPQDQQCCATPIFTSGDEQTARQLIQHNIKVFKGLSVDAIVTGCASCGLAWKKEFPEILNTRAAIREARELSGKTFDISEFLIKNGYRQDFREVNLQVTYHDPCHLKRGQDVFKEPRELIKAIPGIVYKEMAGADQCCGSGGSFNLAYYDISRGINNRKVDNIAKSQAQVVLTGCSACRMHIADGLGRQGKPIQVWHTIQLLDMAYGEKGLEDERRENDGGDDY